MTNIVLYAVADTLAVPLAIWAALQAPSPGRTKPLALSAAATLALITLVFAALPGQSLQTRVSIALLAPLIASCTVLLAEAAMWLSSNMSSGYLARLDRADAAVEILELSRDSNAIMRAGSERRSFRALGVGSTVELHTDFLVIRPSGVLGVMRWRTMGFMALGPAGGVVAKPEAISRIARSRPPLEIPLVEVQSIYFKPWSPTANGYIRFALGREHKPAPSTSSAMFDDTAVFFTKSQQQAFEELRDQISGRAASG